MTFSKDKSMDDRSLWDIARISDRPGPISISNVKIIGFKKIGTGDKGRQKLPKEPL